MQRAPVTLCQSESICESGKGGQDATRASRACLQSAAKVKTHCTISVVSSSLRCRQYSRKRRDRDWSEKKEGMEVVYCLCVTWPKGLRHKLYKVGLLPRSSPGKQRENATTYCFYHASTGHDGPCSPKSAAQDIQTFLAQQR